MTKRCHLKKMLIIALGFWLMFSGQLRADVFTLELEKALNGSDKIASTHQAYLSAREEITIATAGREWTSSLIIDQERTDRQTDQRDIEPTDTGNVTVNVDKKLYDGGVGSAQKTVAMINLDVAQQRINEMEQSVLLEAIRAYTGLAEARDRVAISRANLNRLDQYLRASELQLQLGDITATSLAGTEARHARANASLIQAESQLSSQEATYTAIIGEPPARLSLPSPQFDLPKTAVAAADQAVENHPSYRISALQERIARKTLDVLIAGVRPNVNLNLSSKSTDTTSEQMDSETQSATIMLTMPLLPSKSVYAKSRGAVADHRQALFSQKDAEKSTRLAAENAFRRFQSAEAVIKAYQSEFNAASIVRDGTEREVEFGEKTLLDQLDAEQDAVTAELNLLIARHDRIDAFYSLMASIGFLTATNLGLTGPVSPEDAEPIKSPIITPLPILNYPE
jgi:outer membrane protein